MQYWVVIDNQRKGPLTFDQLKELNLSPNSLVWRDGLEDWTKASDLSELTILFNNENAVPEIKPEVPQMPDTKEEAAETPEKAEVAEETVTTDNAESEAPTNAEEPAETEKATVNTTEVQAAGNEGEDTAANTQQTVTAARYQYLDEEPKKPRKFLALSITATAVAANSFSLIGIAMGVIAIIFSTKVDSRYKKGNYSASKKFSRVALILAIAALVWSICEFIILNIILQDGTSSIETTEMLNDIYNGREWYMP